MDIKGISFNSEVLFLKRVHSEQDWNFMSQIRSEVEKTFGINDPEKI